MLVPRGCFYSLYEHAPLLPSEHEGPVCHRHGKAELPRQMGKVNKLIKSYLSEVRVCSLFPGSRL